MWKELKDLGGPKPLEIYPKGDFKMMLFMRFASKAQCDTATSLLKNARRLREGKTVWARPELPIEQRVAESFLFGCKKMFLDWDYNKKVTFVDTDTLSLSIDRQLVLKVSVTQRKLNAEWQGSWASWQELQDSSELAALVTKASTSLGDSAGKTKGTGKGPATQ